LSTLASLSSLFAGCLEAWFDDQASRYAQVLSNCLEVNVLNKVFVQRPCIVNIPGGAEFLKL
jgi:hypothetical protein